MKKLLCIFLIGLPILTLNAQGYAVSYFEDAGNPGGLNTDSYTSSTGWTEISPGGQGANEWTSPEPLPFPFDFYGNPVSYFQVSLNGVLTFDTATTIIPGDNAALPSASLPDSSIAFFWDAFTTSPPLSTADDIDMKVFGTAPNRQLWVRYAGFELNGNSRVYSAVVLEETSNKIYIVDLQSTNSNGLSATVGVQATSSLGVDVGSNLTISANAATTADNDYYEFTFVPAGVCFPPTDFASNDFTSSEVTLVWNEAASGSSFTVEYGLDGFAQGSGQTLTGITDTFVVVTGLDAYADYDFYVSESCTGSTPSALAGPVSVLTAMGEGSKEDFSGSFLPLGWGEAQGVIDNPTSFTSTTSAGWTQDEFSNRGVDEAANELISGSSNEEWLISHSIYLPAGNNLALEFDASVTRSGANVLGVLATDDTIHVVISLDNGATWNRSDALLTIDENSTIAANSGVHYTLPLTAYSGLVKVGFYSESSVSGGSADLFIDNVQLRQVGACPQPSAAFASTITTTSFDVNWTANGGASFALVWGPAGFNQATATATVVTAPPYTITGLSPYTAYDVYLWNECAGTTSDTIFLPGTITAIQPAWLEDFEGNDFVPFGWEERAGVIGNPTNFVSFTSAGWTSDDFANITGAGESANMVIFSFSGVLDDWLITPLIDLGTGNNFQLEFDAALTSSGGTAPETFDADDSLKVVISTDGGDTWSNVNSLLSLGAGSEPSNTGSQYVVDLSAYSGLVKFGFLVESSTSAGSSTREVFVDNVQVRVPPNCASPLNIVTSGDGDSVTVSWSVLSPANSYTLDYGPDGYGLSGGTQITGITDTFYTITGLPFNTGYDFYVQADCGAVDGVSQFAGPGGYLTPCDVFIAPLFENFDNWTAGTNDSISVCWDRNPNVTNEFIWRVRSGTTPTTNTGPDDDRTIGGNYMFTESSEGGSGAQAAFIVPSLDVSALNTPEVAFYYHMYGETTGDLYIEISDGVNTYTEVGLISGEQQTASADLFRQQVINLAPYPLASDTISISVIGRKGTGRTGDMAIDDFEVREAQTCPVPYDVNISGITSTSAIGSWISGTGTTNLEWGPSGFTQGSGTGTLVKNASNPFPFNGLTPNTSYDFYIQDSCTSFPNGTWIGPFTFTTKCTSVLSGTYTIGGPAGPTNFPTLDSAVQVLNDCGISSSVVFEIAPGTYNETVTIFEVEGADASNTVTFIGTDPLTTNIVHDGSTSNATIALDGADYITFKNLTIQNTKGSDEAIGIFLTGAADHNTIDSCLFLLPNSDNDAANIFAGDDITSVSTGANGTNASDLVVRNSVFDGGEFNILFVGNDDNVNLTSGLTIENCVFTGFDEVSLSIQNVNDIHILNDSIVASVGRYAIDMDDVSNFDVSGNYIRNLGTVATFSIFTGNDDANVTLNGNSRISNNIIHSTNNWSLFLFEVHHTDVVHNTLYSDESDNLYLSSVDDMRVLNNILCAPKGEGLTYSGGTPPAATNEVDYNLYFPLRSDNFPATYIPVIVDGSTRYNLADWQASQSDWDQNSVAGDPEFVSATDLHVQGYLADNAGIPVIGLTDDYDGDIRSLTTPDIGADEYMAIACPKPTGLDVTGTTSTSADLIWDGIGTAYEVEWGELDFVLGNGTTVSTTTNTTTLTGLTGGLTYDFYVRNNCAPNQSEWAGPFSFVIECGNPLNGTYTIDATLPSGGTNYSSVRIAALALSQCGISGPVTFNIAAGTYSGAHIFGAISGASATNTIRFVGASVSSTIISSTGEEVLGNQATILLDSTDYITFRDVTIQNTKTADAWGVLLTHDADHNNFINCHFDMPNTTSGDVAGLVASNSLVNDNSTGDNASYLTIDSCHFTGGEKGIVVDGSGSGFDKLGLRITNTIIESFDETGIDINEMDSIHIEGNTIRNIGDASSSFAIDMDDVINFVLTRNTIIASDEGININDGNNTNNPAVRSEISNNMIIAGGDHAADIVDVTDVNIFHNSLVGEPAIDIDQHDRMSIRNNIFYGRASEAFLSDDPLGSLTAVDIDYNLYYSSDTVAEYPIDIDGTDYATLADWVTADNTRNANSIEGDPDFLDVTSDLHMERPIADGVGDNAVNILVDIDGDTRPLAGSTVVDMGADEYIAATCFAPDSLMAINILTNAVELDWVTGDATAWQVQYGPEGFVPGAGTLLGTTTKPFTVSSLTEATCYDFYVRDSCAVGDVSAWFGPLNLCTDYTCNIATLPTLLGDTLLCAPQIDTLYGTTTEDLFVWINDKGYVYHQNDTLITDTIFTDTTFYAADVSLDGPQGRHVGPLTSIAAQGFGNFSNGMMFTVLKPLVLDSVTMKSDGARGGRIRIWEPDSINNEDIDVSKATLIQDVAYDLPSAGEFQVPVGIVLAPGRYFINLSYLTGSGSMFRSTTGADFPYVLDNLVSIDSSVGTSNFPSTRIYYFFDWVVSGACIGNLDSIEVSFGGAPTASFTSAITSVTLNDATVDFDASASASGITDYEWDFGDGNVGTGVSPQHQYTANGTYDVELVVFTKCGETDTLVQQVVIQGIGLEENALSRSLELFPNPTDKSVHLSFEAAGAQSAMIRLLDFSGKEVKRFHAENINGSYKASIDLSDLPSGVYSLSIQAGDLRAVRKVLKHK